ncbi:MAG: hypothetical protein ACREPD_14490 [Stenotrophomonas sp.]|uniref:hypothetical protein n=1 Tax=Stenotrophomonas sp. TaxID=69392 RepID=UPI003D6D9076
MHFYCTYPGCALLLTDGHISQLLQAFPVAHLPSYGPRNPGVTALHAQWLPDALALLYCTAVISLLVAAGIWRSGKQIANRPFALFALAAVDYSLSLFCCLALLTAWFLLSRLAKLH